jgi:hypothetical protein
VQPTIDPFTAAEYAIGFESLRFLTQAEVARVGSAAALARELRLPVRPLRRFLAGDDPTPGIWRALTEHTRRPGAARPIAPLGLLGLAVTASALPRALRRDARLAMARSLIALHAEHGLASPPWLHAVADRGSARSRDDPPTGA